LLVVISILGILAALTVPALKNLGKANINASASRQLLDDIGYARQLAMSHRTTVYMVFLPTNFWAASWLGNPGLTFAQRSLATNLCDKQLTGYTFVTLRTVGDQPGSPTKHYLKTWRTLPEGTFIYAQKFAGSNVINDPSGTSFPIWEFNYITNAIPFPTADAPVAPMPYIAFNYLGQLTVDGQNVSSRDEYIPLAHGSVAYGRDANKNPQIATVADSDITESPPGNSTNIAYNIVHIDAFTGRATLEFHRLP
jgi:type II secretory pathway pseudopilin PulG